MPAGSAGVEGELALSPRRGRVRAGRDLLAATDLLVARRLGQTFAEDVPTCRVRIG